MKLFERAKDGGPSSPVEAFFLFEIKNFASVALLKFNEGTRENYHSHAFNALTWFLFGDMVEEKLVDGKIVSSKYRRSLFPKYTAKDNLHKVVANKTSWCFTLRGKWQSTWYEYNEDNNLKITMTNGRRIIKEENFVK